MGVGYFLKVPVTIVKKLSRQIAMRRKERVEGKENFELGWV